MMKARGKSRGVFRENIKLNICAIQESNWMGNEVREILVDREAMALEQNRQRERITYLADTFKDAKEFGSVLELQEQKLQFLEQRIDEVENNVARDLWEVPYWEAILEKLPGILLQAKIMQTKYDVVCTNPPYMGRKGMNHRLSDYVDKNFVNSKNDLFAVFIEKSIDYSRPDGFVSMITQHAWMFLSSFETLREKLIGQVAISSMNHLGPRAFEEIGGEVVQSTAFILRNSRLENARGVYIRLVDCKSAELKEAEFHNCVNKVTATKSGFKRIPGSPIAYWVSERVREIFEEGTPLGNLASPVKGLDTCDNNLFLRLWFEVDTSTIGFGVDERSINGSNHQWFPYCKGGDYRKWFGNYEYVVLWKDNGAVLKNLRNDDGSIKSRPQNTRYYFNKGITWSSISSSNFSVRDMENAIFGGGGSALFLSPEAFSTVFALLNSKLVLEILRLLNPTLNFLVGDVKKIPIMDSKNMEPQIQDYLARCVMISKMDWDFFETSWDFKTHPLLAHKNDAVMIQQIFNTWANFAETQFKQLKANEEELNRIFIEIYGLQDELTPEVEDKDITIRKADQSRDVKSFISYAVGCMLGRYSLDEEGLVLVGGKFEPERYITYKVDADGILPVLADSYFEDDIVTQFVEFVRVAFGENTLSKNLDYIAETLARKANETSRECIRRYFLKDFYKEHVQRYKKRPIYWLFTSGKEQGFNVLVYMHRYDGSMVSRVRTDYLHPLQNKLEAEFLRLNQALVSEDSPTEKTKATKRLKILTKQMDELKKYDEVIHNLADQQIEIDLNEGVVVNYAKFEKVLAKI